MAQLEKKEATPSVEDVFTPPSPSSDPSGKERIVDSQETDTSEDIDPPREIHGVKVTTF